MCAGKPRRLFVTAMNWPKRIGRSGNFLYQNVYYHPRVAEVNRRACEMLRRVFEAYLADPDRLGEGAMRRVEKEGLHRTVCDYIAGMTDRYVMEEYARIAGVGIARAAASECSFQRSVPSLRGGVADLVAQISDKKTEALIERAFFEQSLPAQRIVHERRSHEVRQHFQVAQFGKIPIQFCGKLTVIVLEAAVKLDHFCSERFGLNRSRIARFYSVDTGDRKRLLLFETGEAHTLQTLQDQIRSAVTASDTSANQSCGGEMEKILGGMPVRAARLDQRHAKHAMPLKRVLQHLR